MEGFSDLKEDFKQTAPTLDRMKNADVLFIDDQLPILISSELDVEQIDEVLGSRIYEMFQDFTVMIEDDLRQLNQKMVGLNDV